MTESAITISVKLREDDLVDFYTYNARKSILMKLLIACALLTFFAQLIRIIVNVEALYEGSWKWILAVIALFFFMYYMNKSNAQKEFKKNKRLHESHIYIVSEDSIHIKGGPFDTIFQWDRLYGMTESKKSFFIWLSKNSVQIIPKRDMTLEEIEKVSFLRKEKFKK